MFERLQKKWKVGIGRLLLILITFAVGGSLTGWLGRKIIVLLGIRSTAVFIPAYIIIITILWPIAVLVISIFTGQFRFFRNYLKKMGKKIQLRSTEYKVQSGQEVIQKSEIRNPKSNPKPHTPNPKLLAVFASGAGSNAQQLINYFKESEKARVALIVCNKPGVGVIAIAEKENIPVLMIEKERFFRGDAYLPELRQLPADLLVLAGFLWKIPRALIDAYPRRIVNIHPALLPKYGGKGMYGSFVHEAVVGAGEVQSGITIHYVDEHYDNGDIIFQTACPVLPNDTPAQLANRIHELEHAHYARVVEQIAGEL